MFKRKRLVRVEVSFLHGRQEIPKQVIELFPGQSFQKTIGSDIVMENGSVIKRFDWKAGYTVVYEYFYI